MDAENTLLNIVNVVLYNNSLPEIQNLDSSLRIRQDLEFDSITMAEFGVRIEDEFDIDVFENGIPNTIGDILALIKK